MKTCRLEERMFHQLQLCNGQDIQILYCSLVLDYCFQVPLTDMGTRPLVQLRPTNQSIDQPYMVAQVSS